MRVSLSLGMLTSALALFSSASSAKKTVTDVGSWIAKLLPQQDDAEVRYLLECLSRRLDVLAPVLSFCELWARDKGSAIGATVFHARSRLANVETFIRTCLLDPNRTQINNRAAMTDALKRQLADIDFALTSVNLAMQLVNSSSSLWAQQQQHLVFNSGQHAQQPQPAGGVSRSACAPSSTAPFGRVVSPSSLLAASQRLAEMGEQGGDLSVNGGRLLYLAAPFSSSSCSAPVGISWETRYQHCVLKICHRLRRREGAQIGSGARAAGACRRYELVVEVDEHGGRPAPDQPTDRPRPSRQQQETKIGMEREEGKQHAHNNNYSHGSWNFALHESLELHLTQTARLQSLGASGWPQSVPAGAAASSLSCTRMPSLPASTPSSSASPVQPLSSQQSSRTDPRTESGHWKEQENTILAGEGGAGEGEGGAGEGEGVVHSPHCLAWSEKVMGRTTGIFVFEFDSEVAGDPLGHGVGASANGLLLSPLQVAYLAQLCTYENRVRDQAGEHGGKRRGGGLRLAHLSASDEELWLLLLDQPSSPLPIQPLQPTPVASSQTEAEEVTFNHAGTDRDAAPVNPPSKLAGGGAEQGGHGRQTHEAGMGLERANFREEYAEDLQEEQLQKQDDAEQDQAQNLSLRKRKSKRKKRRGSGSSNSGGRCRSGGSHSAVRTGADGKESDLPFLSPLPSPPTSPLATFVALETEVDSKVEREQEDEDRPPDEPQDDMEKEEPGLGPRTEADNKISFDFPPSSSFSLFQTRPCHDASDGLLTSRSSSPPPKTDLSPIAQQSLWAAFEQTVEAENKIACKAMTHNSNPSSDSDEHNKGNNEQDTVLPVISKASEDNTGLVDGAAVIDSFSSGASKTASVAIQTSYFQ
eukprot:g62314.t1